MAKPACYRVLLVEHGAKPGPLAKLRAQVIVTGSGNHWRIVKNKTGLRLQLKP